MPESNVRREAADKRKAAIESIRVLRGERRLTTDQCARLVAHKVATAAAKLTEVPATPPVVQGELEAAPPPTEGEPPPEPEPAPEEAPAKPGRQRSDGKTVRHLWVVFGDLAACKTIDNLSDQIAQCDAERQLAIREGRLREGGDNDKPFVELYEAAIERLKTMRGED